MPGDFNDRDDAEDNIVQEGSNIISLQVYIDDYLVVMPHHQSIAVFGDHWTFEDMESMPALTNQSLRHGPGGISGGYLIENEPTSVADFGNSHLDDIIGRVGWYGRFWADNYINNSSADCLSRLGRRLLEGSRSRSSRHVYDGLTRASGVQWRHATEMVPYQVPIYSGPGTSDLVDLLCSSFQEGFVFQHDARLARIIALVFGFDGRPIPGLPVD